MGDPAVTEVFTYTGATQTWTVPAGVHLVSVDVVGAGATVGLSAAVAVTPGDVMTVVVGGLADGASGGWPNGGNGEVAIDSDGAILGTAGSGGSDLRSSPSRADILLVAPGVAGLGVTERDGALTSGRPTSGAAELDEYYGYTIRTSPPAVTDVPRRVRVYADGHEPPEWDPSWFTSTAFGSTGGDQTGAAGWASTVHVDGTNPLADFGAGDVLVLGSAGGGGMGGGASAHLYLRNGTAPTDIFVPPFLVIGGDSGGYYAAPGVSAERGPSVSGIDYDASLIGGIVRISYLPPGLTAVTGWGVGHVAS